MGKSGGVRLIYYFWMGPNAVVLITVYAKNEEENLTDADKKEIRKIIESLATEAQMESGRRAT